MKKEKDIWIDQILLSTEGMSPAEPSPFLLAKTINKLRSEEAYQEPYFKMKISFALLSLSLLLVLNLFLLSQLKQGKMSFESPNPIVNNLELYE